MREIRNSAGKLVCQIDDDTHTILIVRSGNWTRLRMLPDGTIEVLNN
jgi:hypothetical protein